MKATSFWRNGEADTDDFGFSGLPGGVQDEEGKFYNVEASGLWWALLPKEESKSTAWKLFSYDVGLIRVYTLKSNAVSVRCLQDM